MPHDLALLVPQPTEDANKRLAADTINTICMLLWGVHCNVALFIVPQQSERYDEQRVQRLRARLEAAAARLESDGPLPLADTRVFPPGNEDQPCIGKGPPSDGTIAAVVLVTFNRYACPRC